MLRYASCSYFHCFKSDDFFSIYRWPNSTAFNIQFFSAKPPPKSYRCRKLQPPVFTTTRPNYAHLKESKVYRSISNLHEQDSCYFPLASNIYEIDCRCTHPKSIANTRYISIDKGVFSRKKQHYLIHLYHKTVQQPPPPSFLIVTLTSSNRWSTYLGRYT